jgi:UBX domain
MTNAAVQIRWRGRLVSLPTTPETTMADVRAALAGETDVPPARQTLLLAGRRDRPTDAELAADVLPPGRAVTMLGTPRVAAAAAAAASAEAVTDDEGDLGDLTADAVPLAPPPPPPPPPRRVWRPEGGAPLPAGVPFPAPGTLDEVWSVGDSAEEDEAAGAEPRAQTNGAALRLEDVDEFLAPAACGSAFVERHAGGALRVLQEASFLKAVTASKAALKMLAVLLLDLHEPAGGEGGKSGTGAAESVESSVQFYRHTLQAPAVADVLNENFVTFAADCSPLPDTGAALLERLGLHSLPAVLLLSDVGSGVGIVDMFAASYYAGPLAAEQIMGRLLETQAVFEFGYEAARARRAASEDRGAIIAEQNAEFLASSAADRAREEAAAEELLRIADADRAAVEEAERATRRLPAPPKEGGARLALRLPDGRRVDRRFDEMETRVRDLFDWCVSLGVRDGSFALSVSFPRRTLSLDEHGSRSLQAVGLVPTAVLLVDIL